MTHVARRFLVRGVVQGVGFRPFVHRLAREFGITGWVLNREDGVAIHAEGAAGALVRFERDLARRPPPAARIASLEREVVAVEGFVDFVIRPSRGADRPTVRIAADLPICDECLAELLDPGDRRAGYPYINCTNCGPRFSIILGLPYDRSRTTMAGWRLCQQCAAEYEHPTDRRFHAQPTACPVCGPHYFLLLSGERIAGDAAAIAAASAQLRRGSILAVKGIGGYHLACDARQEAAVQALRRRKVRKERPFALLARDLAEARSVVELSAAAEELLTSPAAPIVLAPARAPLPAVAPDTTELGVMLPYAPLHHLLFAAGAPPLLVLTSANRSAEPIAYRDEDALTELAGVADAFLVGERPIARRVDDSVAHVGAFGPTVLRRARGYSPIAVGRAWPSGPPILAVGGDLKNAVTLVVKGQAFVSQHVGDLDHLAARQAFEATCSDLPQMYGIAPAELLVVCDRHPDYVSAAFARQLPGRQIAVQHHWAHVASVLAEQGAWESRVLGIAADGAGWGDDGAVWGGEIFVGSLPGGFARVAHLRGAQLPGGDAAAVFPPQAAAGFLAQIEALPDLAARPFAFPERFAAALSLARRGSQCHPTTSLGRLFDAVAALCGFTREISFEGQAAMWLEQRARRSRARGRHPLPWTGDELDFRPLLETVIRLRRAGRDPADIARMFHNALASALVEAALRLTAIHDVKVVVLSGGVFQNALLLAELRARLPRPAPFEIWVNHETPPNDGGLSLGQAALALAALPAADASVVASESAGGCCGPSAASP